MALHFYPCASWWFGEGVGCSYNINLFYRTIDNIPVLGWQPDTSPGYFLFRFGGNKINKNLENLAYWSKRELPWLYNVTTKEIGNLAQTWNLYKYTTIFIMHMLFIMYVLNATSDTTPWLMLIKIHSISQLQYYLYNVHVYMYTCTCRRVFDQMIWYRSRIH